LCTANTWTARWPSRSKVAAQRRHAKRRAVGAAAADVVPPDDGRLDERGGGERESPPSTADGGVPAARAGGGDAADDMGPRATAAAAAALAGHPPGGRGGNKTAAGNAATAPRPPPPRPTGGGGGRSSWASPGPRTDGVAWSGVDDVHAAAAAADDRGGDGSRAPPSATAVAGVTGVPYAPIRAATRGRPARRRALPRGASAAVLLVRGDTTPAAVARAGESPACRTSTSGDGVVSSTVGASRVDRGTAAVAAAAPAAASCKVAG